LAAGDLSDGLWVEPRLSLGSPAIVLYLLLPPVAVCTDGFERFIVMILVQCKRKWQT
jgi:hypothetical protein